jgi:lysozyme
MFYANWEGANAAGLPRGAYHFFSFCTTPEAQLENIRHVVPAEPNALPLALDIELYDGQESSSISFLAREGACAARLAPDGIRRMVSAMIDGLE